MACRRRSLLLASLALVLRRCRSHQKENKKHRRRFWVRNIFTEERTEWGEWENLFHELSNDVREYYYRYLRVSPERFEHLSNFCWSVNSQTRHKLQMSIPAKKRLVITLRYLAEGCSQQTLSFSFQFGKSTVSKILKEVCVALYTVLVTHYLLPPSTVEDWKLISSEFLELWNMPHVIGAIDGKHVAMNAQKILGHYITITRDFSLRYYLLFVMQNISSFSLTSDNMVVQIIASFSKTRSFVDTMNYTHWISLLKI